MILSRLFFRQNFPGGLGPPLLPPYNPPPRPPAPIRLRVVAEAEEALAEAEAEDARPARQRGEEFAIFMKM